MSEPSSWEKPSYGEHATPGDFVLYLQGQFSDAVEKELSEDSRGEESVNGTFIQHALVEDETTPGLVQGAWRIVLKDPHPYDLPGTYTEVYAIMPVQDADKRLAPLASIFIVRDVDHGAEGPWLSVDENGAYDPGITEPNPEWETDPAEGVKKALELHVKLSHRNIVAQGTTGA